MSLVAARLNLEGVASSQPVVTVLSAVALELQELADLSDRLQPFISTALVADGSRNAEHVHEFQALDLLVQRLQGVASFVNGLVERAPEDWRIDVASAASNILLADLALRLSGASEGKASTRQASKSASGDLELFG